MLVAILVLIVAFAVFWLVFFKVKRPGWAIVLAFFVIHVMLVFMIGLRFVTPNSTNATIVQRTTQLIPRLPQPTLDHRGNELPNRSTRPRTTPTPSPLSRQN